MSNQKYQPAADRVRTDGSTYQWKASWAGGHPMTFDSESKAVEYARQQCSDPAHHMTNPGAVKV